VRWKATEGEAGGAVTGSELVGSLAKGRREPPVGSIELLPNPLAGSMEERSGGFLAAVGAGLGILAEDLFPPERLEAPPGSLSPSVSRSSSWLLLSSVAEAPGERSKRDFP